MNDTAMINLENQIRQLTDIFGESRIRSTFRKLAEIEAGRCLKKSDGSERVKIAPNYL